MSHRQRASGPSEVHAPDARFESVLAVLENVRDASSPPASVDTSARLAYAAQLLHVLEQFIPELQRVVAPGRLGGTEAVVMRVAVDLYDRAARELRAAADEARRCCDHADAILADVHAVARRRHRQARRVAEKRQGIRT